jgi:hypothetical protein
MLFLNISKSEAKSGTKLYSEPKISFLIQERYGCLRNDGPGGHTSRLSLAEITSLPWIAWPVTVTLQLDMVRVASNPIVVHSTSSTLPTIADSVRFSSVHLLGKYTIPYTEAQDKVEDV